MSSLRIAVISEERAQPSSPWLGREGEFDAIEEHPFWGGFGQRYYPVVFGERRKQASFAVVDGDRPLAIVFCSVGEDRLDWYGLPAAVWVSNHLSDDVAARVAAMTLEAVESLVREHGLQQAVIADPGSKGRLSRVGVGCLGRDWVGSLHLSGTCDLAGGEAGIRRALRKSFRSLVNWGRNNLHVTYVNASNPAADEFSAYRQFHLKIAGRSTRPEASWAAMLDWIVAGRGELALGRLDTGELVAGTMVVDGSTTTYYASGVYDRERFDKPMAHFPMYDAIVRSGARGMKVFDLGDIPQAGTVSPKEYNIGYFKRGFASEIAISMRWTWTRQERDKSAGT